MPDAERHLSSANEATARPFSRAARIVLVLVAGVYAAARLWRLTASCLWFDEIFSVHAARHAWGNLVRFVAADIIHPPLFYALLKIWVALGGESLLWLRLFPALTAVACIIPLILLCRELRLTAFETNLALLLTAASGYLIKYAQEVRMYSLLLLLTLTSLWLFARLPRAAGPGIRRTFIALLFVNLLLVYTHYYGWLLVAAQLTFLLVRHRRLLLGFSLTVALLAVCFAPWLYGLAAARAEQGRGVEQNLGWATRPSAADAARYVPLLHEPFYFRQSSNEPAYLRWGDWAATLVFVVPVLMFAARVLRRREEGRDGGELFAWLLVFSFLPVALAFALSHALPQSVWGTRHLIVAAAPCLMLSGVALARARPVWLRSALLVVMSCWFFWGAAVAHLRGGDRYIWCAWEELAAQMRRAESPDSRGVPVYAFEDLVAYHLWFALDARFEPSVVKGVPGLAEDPAYFLPRAFDGVRVVDSSGVEGERFWVAFRDSRWNEARPPLKILKERGYLFEEVREFHAQGQRAFLVSVRR